MSKRSSKQNRCIATAEISGLRCRRTVVDAGEYCLAHDPSYKEFRTAMAIKGGRAVKKPLPQLKNFRVTSSRDIKHWLEYYIEQSVKGNVRINPKDASSLAKAYMDAENRVDLIDRVEAIEKKQS